MPSIRLRSPSKINLHLRVAGPDATGFHPLRSWFVTTDLCDEIGVTLRGWKEPKVVLRCDEPSLPVDASNLVVRAANAYLDAFASLQPLAVEWWLEFDLSKRIPAGAGLGGGSSNAAATLRAIDAMLAPDYATRPTLEPIAATLGSDVPFFLGEPSAVGTGRGDVLVAAPTPRASFALLLFPPFGVSTPAAYRMLDRLRPVAPADVLDPFDVDAWATLDALALSERLINDLEPAAFAIEPRLSALRDRAEATLGRPVRMSGSGSTLFALFDDAPAATGAADVIAASIPELRSHVARLGTARIGDGLSSKIF